MVDANKRINAISADIHVVHGKTDHQVIKYDREDFNEAIGNKVNIDGSSEIRPFLMGKSDAYE
ncbi:hypothetical protein KIN20_009769 [Parelaphostrongylus tenuis]|uniref:Uncharacterized protein n=1 Tax=Parelaphostrongylus tenuis TaxID=148309 RepID=A0AAD5M6W7_PARTN|nr:hypothetical protein KIN20_009769 [Parelaphostrongylus tenuis]